jgi:uncharacterized protein (DUF1800 family)
MSQCLDILLAPSTLPDPSPPVNAYSDDSLEDPAVPFGEVWVFAPKPTTPMDVEFGNEAVEGRRNNNLKGWWAGCMINQERNLTEKMLIFWHNNLATQSYEMQDARYTYRHVALLRKHALGNFRTLVKEVTVDPCMLVFLNGNTNVKGTPNENYGRELQELFTIGRSKDSHYTEDDVKAAARVLTGWRDDENKITSYFDPEKHDTSDKKFSAFYGNTVIKGRSGPEGAKETDALIAMLFKNKETAKSLSRKLYRWFIHYNLTEEVETQVITPLSEIIIKHDYNMVPVLRALLSSDWFYSDHLHGQMIKSGLDYGVGLVRQYDVAFPKATDLAMLYTAWYAVAGGIAQFLEDIGDPPSVAGWPAYYENPSYHKRWVDSNLLQLRRSISGGFASMDGLPTEAWTFRIDFIGYASKFDTVHDTDQFIKDTLDILIPLNISDTQKNKLRKILNNNTDDNAYWSTLWTGFGKDQSNTALKDEIRDKLSAFYTLIMDLSEYQMM